MCVNKVVGFGWRWWWMVKLLPLCRAWNVTICSLTPALLIHILSFSSVWSGSELLLGVWSIGCWLLNAYVLSVSGPHTPDPVWERFCDLLLPNMACFGLRAPPFQWCWHCRGAHILYCWPYSFLSWTKSRSTTTATPLCMWSAILRGLLCLSAGGLSETWGLFLLVLEQGGEMKTPFIFTPFSAPYWNFGGL